MIALFIPWLLLLVLFVVIVLLIKKKWRASLLLAAIIIIVNWWGECIPFRLFVGDINKAAKLKIICFNIDGSSGDNLQKSKDVRAIIKHYSPDIVFIAEFNEEYPKPLDSLLSEDFVYTTYPGELYYQYFYSNYPLINSRRLKNRNDEDVGVYTCSTVIQGDTIDLYGCHFASNNYNEQYERQSIEDIHDQVSFFNYIKNIQTSGNRRKIEAETIVHEMSKSSHQAIVLGDMNDVCGSSVLNELETRGIIDAWWEGGFGYGATIHKPLPYRIDHIMHTNGLELQSIRVIDSNGVSDHDALYAEFNLKE